MPEQQGIFLSGSKGCSSLNYMEQSRKFTVPTLCQRLSPAHHKLSSFYTCLELYVISQCNSPKKVNVNPDLSLSKFTRKWDRKSLIIPKMTSPFKARIHPLRLHLVPRVMLKVTDVLGDHHLGHPCWASPRELSSAALT